MTTLIAPDGSSINTTEIRTDKGVAVNLTVSPPPSEKDKGKVFKMEPFTLQGEVITFEAPHSGPYSNVFSAIFARSVLMELSEDDLREGGEAKGEKSWSYMFEMLRQEVAMDYLYNDSMRPSIVKRVQDYLAEYPHEWLEESLNFAIANPPKTEI